MKSATVLLCSTCVNATFHCVGEPCPFVCKEKEFKCKTNNECIPIEDVCNQEYDCSDKSDEYDCGTCISYKHFVLLAFCGSTKRKHSFICLQCFDAVGWVAGRASGL